MGAEEESKRFRTMTTHIQSHRIHIILVQHLVHKSKAAGVFRAMLLKGESADQLRRQCFFQTLHYKTSKDRQKLRNTNKNCEDRSKTQD